MSLDMLVESKNDKLLIYEVSRLLRYYKDNSKKCDMNFVKKVLDIYLKNDSLYLYNGIYSDNFKNGIGVYYQECDKILLNFPGITNMVSKSKRVNIEGCRFNIGSIDKSIYFSVLHVLFHELTHAKQAALMNSVKNNFVTDIYRYCYNFIEENGFLYIQIHDSVPFERYADLRSLYLANEVIDYVYPNENNLLFKLEYFYVLLYDYNINGIYPLNFFASLLPEDDFSSLIPDVSLLDNNFWERIQLGLEISPDEYLYLCDLSDDLIYKFKDNEYVNKENTVSIIKKKIMSKSF